MPSKPRSVPFKPLIGAVTLGMLVGACARFPDGVDEASFEGTTDFCAVQTEIFTERCTTCHSGTDPFAGLDLSEGISYESIVGVPSGELPSMDLVSAGDSQNSYLYHKVAGTHEAVGGSGSQMPIGEVLSSAELAIVSEWIDAGASEECSGTVAPTPEPTPEPTLEPTPESTPEPSVAPYLCGVQAQIFDTYCMSCHNAASNYGGLTLEADVSYANLVNQASGELSSMNLVTPNDPDNSYLYHKLAGTHEDVGGSGSQMPLGGNITTEELALVKTWILEGAPERCGEEEETDTVSILSAIGDAGTLEVAGELTASSSGGFAQQVSLYDAGLNTDGSTCDGTLLGQETPSTDNGGWRFSLTDLPAVPATVCVASSGGGATASDVTLPQ